MPTIHVIGQMYRFDGQCRPVDEILPQFDKREDELGQSYVLDPSFDSVAIIHTRTRGAHLYAAESAVVVDGNAICDMGNGVELHEGQTACVTSLLAGEDTSPASIHIEVKPSMRESER
jgi:hypothetical protein